MRTGNDRLMVGFNRRFAPLFTDLRDALRRRRRAGDRCATSSTPAGSTRQLVPQRGARGLAVRRRGRPLHRHAELVARRPRPGRGARRSRRRAAGDLHVDAALRRRLARHDQLRRPAATRRFPKETLDVTGGGRNARLDNFTRATVWTGRRQATRKRARRSGQGPAGRAGSASSRRCATAARCRSRWTRSSPPPARPSRSARSLVDRTGRWRCEPAAWAGTSRRLRRMSPAEMVSAHRRRDAPPYAWARRQVRPGATPSPVSGLLRSDRRFPTPLPPGTPRARCRRRPAAAASHAADRMLAGRLGGARRRRGPTSPTRTGSCDPVTGRRAPQRPATRSASTTATRPRPATSSRSGSCRATTTSPCSPRPGG